MGDARFRRARFERFADAETVDRLEAEHAELTEDQQLERNDWVDSVSDADLRDDAGIPADADDDGDTDAKPAKRASARKTTAGSSGEPVVD